MRSVPRSVLIVTAVLIASVVLAEFPAPLWLMQAVVLAGWCLVVWMVLDVLRDRSAHVRQLEPDEHWGYQDRPDLRPVRSDGHPERPRRPRDDLRT